MSMSALHTDLYQINMAYVFFKDNIHEKKAVFELYFRKLPFDNGYSVFGGLERIIDFINNFKFTKTDIDYLKQFNYSSAFLDYLSKIKFTGNIYALKEGEVCFAKEGLVVVEANLIEAQLIETALLNIVNFQTLIATKASRIRNLVPSHKLFEFGARRAQEMDAALWGTRAAYIAGFDGTSLVEAGQKFNIPVVGTHSHSFVQVYQDEYIAFTKYSQTHKNCTFLVDTYNTLKSGVNNAIKVAKEFKDGQIFEAIRIDSGDLAYQSKIARKMLDDAGFINTKIVASNDLDEEIIASLLIEKAKIDSFGIGTRLITSYNQPALGAVYKLVAIENDENGYDDVIKVSDNPEKITTPGKKNLYRIISNVSNKAIGDYITLDREDIISSSDLKLYNEENSLLFKKVENFTLLKLRHDIFINGVCVYDIPTTIEVRKYHKHASSLIWDEHKRYKYPARYYVCLSNECYKNKKDLQNKYT